MYEADTVCLFLPTLKQVQFCLLVYMHCLLCFKKNYRGVMKTHFLLNAEEEEGEWKCTLKYNTKN